MTGNFAATVIPAKAGKRGQRPKFRGAAIQVLTIQSDAGQERMRLTASQTEIIRQAARQNFCADASAWLFGSRVDDGRRGGDVGLYIESARESTLCLVALQNCSRRQLGSAH